MKYESLLIRVELRTSRPSPAGIVVLVNRGSTEVRLWRQGNTWGDDNLTFEVLQDRRTWRFLREVQIYSRNIPAFLAVPGGASYRLTFDLGDGSWEVDTRSGQVIAPGSELVAVYDVQNSPEALQFNVWTGRLRSNPVRLS